MAKKRSKKSRSLITSRQLLATGAVALTAFSFAFLLGLFPFVASAHEATLNSGTTVTVAEGETIHVSVTAHIDGIDHSLPNSNHELNTIQYGFRQGATDTGVVCQDVADGNVHSGDHQDFVRAFDITAPLTPGVYDFFFRISASGDCLSQIGTDQVMSGAVTVNAPTPVGPDCSGAIPTSGLLVDAHQSISNDPDSGNATPVWALDAFTRHIRVWQVSGGYCAQADDNGTFVTTGTLSPQNGVALSAGVTGTMIGGTGRITFTGATFADAGSWGNTPPAVDCNATPTTCSNGLTGYWITNYFGAGASYAYPNWSWTYTADCSHNGQWTNSTVSSGDIIDAPACSVVTATSQSVATDKNTAISITLAGTDSVAGNTLVFATSSNPTNGTLATTSDAAIFTYTPNTDYTGSDSFTFTAGDGVATSTGTVSITVNAPASPGGGGTPSDTSVPNGGGIVLGLIGAVTTNNNSNGGLVLGTSTEATGLPAGCTPLLGGYLKAGMSGDAVKKLQAFLNTELGLSLPLTGYFGPSTLDAVKAFQLKYSDDILKPWVPFGLSSDKTATGYVYKTTQRMINLRECSTLTIPMPILP